MGDSSTSATSRGSSAAARSAMAAPIERPQSAGRKGSAGSVRAMPAGECIEPGPDVVGLAAAERRIIPSLWP